MPGPLVRPFGHPYARRPRRAPHAELFPQAAAVVTHAGLRLLPIARPAAILRTVERVISEPAFRAAAQRVGAQLRADAELGRDVAELEALAARSKRLA